MSDNCSQSRFSPCPVNERVRHPKSRLCSVTINLADRWRNATGCVARVGRGGLSINPSGAPTSLNRLLGLYMHTAWLDKNWLFQYSSTNPKSCWWKCASPSVHEHEDSYHVFSRSVVAEDIWPRVEVDGCSSGCRAPPQRHRANLIGGWHKKPISTVRLFVPTNICLIVFVAWKTLAPFSHGWPFSGPTATVWGKGHTTPRAMPASLEAKSLVIGRSPVQAKSHVIVPCRLPQAEPSRRADGQLYND